MRIHLNNRHLNGYHRVGCHPERCHPKHSQGEGCQEVAPETSVPPELGSRMREGQRVPDPTRGRRPTADRKPETQPDSWAETTVPPVGHHETGGLEAGPTAVDLPGSVDSAKDYSRRLLPPCPPDQTRALVRVVANQVTSSTQIQKGCAPDLPPSGNCCQQRTGQGEAELPPCQQRVVRNLRWLSAD